MENQLKDAVIVAYGRSVVGKSGKKDVFRDVHKVDFVLKGVLEKVYPMVFLDAIHYHVRENNIVVKKAVYIALGYGLEGFKEILGLWVGENESSKYWLLVLNGLKERGLEDVLIFSTDNLPGFSEAIEVEYPRAEIHPKSVGKIMYNTSNKKLHKVCILQRHKRDLKAVTRHQQKT